MPDDRTEIPVLVLNWNGFEDTCSCIDALLESQHVRFCIILADNGSGEDECDRLVRRFGSEARVELRLNDDNLGFARGMNALLREILQSRPNCEYVALLNNDAIPEPDWLASLVEAAETSGAGAVASRMLRADNPAVLDNAGHVFLNTGEVLPRGAGRPAREFETPADVAGVCAGACLYRVGMLREIGLFDEFFDTGYEDAELGLRALRADYRQVYAPAAVVRHRIGASIDKIRDFDYAVRLQVNINYAYLKLMPVPVMLWNAPWIVLKTLALLLLPLLVGRWRLFRVQAVAIGQTVRRLGRIRQARAAAPRRKVGILRIAAGQTFFARLYWQYFRRFILSRQLTIFER